MKTRICFFLVLIYSITLSAQTGFSKFPRTYYPQAYFDGNQAKKALEKGTSTIKGTAYGVDYIKGGTVLAREGAVVFLFPYTDYIDDWLNLTNRNKNNANTVYLLPEVFEYRRETTTDAYGDYTFTNLKPGKYYIETIAAYTTTGMDTQQTGTYNYYNMDRYGNMSGGSVPTYGVYTYQYATAKRLFKVVEIENGQEVKKVNLKPTPLVPFVDLDVVGAKKSKTKCYEEKGLLNGNCVTYHPDGKEKVNAEWKKDFYDGDYKEYSTKGILLSEGKFKKGSKIEAWKYYDAESTKLTGIENYVFKDDKSFLEGDLNFYYPNGNLKQVDKYINGKTNGKCIAYYDTGIIESTFEYKDGMLNGITEYFNEKGEKVHQETYKNDKLVK